MFDAICMKILKVLLPFYCFSLSAQFTGYVNPFIGTGGHGHTFPGAVLPFGMVQLSPDTRADNSWDGASGYHYDDSLIYGFSHTHLSGTGVSDWGDILLMPQIGDPSIDHKLYSSSFEHKSEKASPGYYEVMLDKHKIKAQLTVTQRVGIHKYTFPASSEAGILLDLLHRDKTLQCGVNVRDSSTVTGYRVSEGWAKEQHVYFAIRFSKAFSEFLPAGNGSFYNSNTINKQRIEGASFRFSTRAGETILVKVGLSMVSEEGALRNLEQEATHWDFDKYVAAADSIWNKELSCIEVEGDEPRKRIFYSALYHCFIHPSLASDVDGSYRGRDNKIHLAKGFNYYNVFSLWDTYRALHPLFTLVQVGRTKDFIRTLLQQHRDAGCLPVWELSSNETSCMIGFHAASVIADAFAKNIYGYDSLEAYNACVIAASKSAPELGHFNTKGYLEAHEASESVSKTLEYAYDNFCLAVLASRLQKSSDYRLFTRRSLGYRNLFDISSGLMRPRINGDFVSPFDPSEISNHFTESNSWQYSFYAPHDMEGFIQLHGGPEKFEQKLDALFAASSKLTGREQPDVTGLIGQYAHGNEPSHHIAYLYNFVGKPQKTIELVRRIMKDFYTDQPDGLIGNEDCGQMSAWYVFSALGFYPVCPGTSAYVYGEPAFGKIRLRLERGRVVNISSNKAPGKEILQSVSFLNRPSPRSFTVHQLLTRSRNIDFVYGSRNDTSNKYGKEPAYRPRSGQQHRLRYIPAPLIQTHDRIFSDSTHVSIKTLNDSAHAIKYRLQINGKFMPWQAYNKPFTIDTNTVVQAFAMSGRDTGIMATATFYKLKYKYNIALTSEPSPQYRASGGQSLIDGIQGNKNWRLGDWIGIQGRDLEVVVDMRKVKDVSGISLECLQDTRSWILFPVQVSFYGSEDNKDFRLLGSVTNSIKPEDMEVKIQDFRLELPASQKVRYLKIQAGNFGSLPHWHPGSGGKAFIFADELEIR